MKHRFQFAKSNNLDTHRYFDVKKRKYFFHIYFHFIFLLYIFCEAYDLNQCIHWRRKLTISFVMLDALCMFGCLIDLCNFRMTFCLLISNVCALNIDKQQTHLSLPLYPPMVMLGTFTFSLFKE